MPTHAITRANPLQYLIIPCKICKLELLLFPLKAAAVESKPLPNHLLIPLLSIGKQKDNESMYMATMWKQPKHEESSKKSMHVTMFNTKEASMHNKHERKLKEIVHANHVQQKHYESMHKNTNNA